MSTSRWYSISRSQVSGAIAISLLVYSTALMLQHSENKRRDKEARAIADNKDKARRREYLKANRLRQAEIRRAEQEEKRLAQLHALYSTDYAADQRIAKNTLLKEQQLLQQKIISLQRADMITKQERAKKARAIALSQFIGTRYAKLHIAGSTYNDVIITKANEVAITFSYEHGAKRMKLSQFPKEIQELCHYTPAIVPASGSSQLLDAKSNNKENGAEP